MTTYKTRNAVQSSHEELARLRKANKLTALFRNAGVTPEQLAKATNISWEYAAKVTGTHIASEQTRALVLAQLRGDA